MLARSTLDHKTAHLLRELQRPPGYPSLDGPVLFVPSVLKSFLYFFSLSTSLYNFSIFFRTLSASSACGTKSKYR